jgi:hypothetical protein
MSDAILEWLGGRDTGLSSTAIALTALGKMPKNPNYPRDDGDFGRCYRLIKAAPGAVLALDVLARDGGPVWAALVPRWAEIEVAYLHDMEHPDTYRCFELMQSIIRPAEKNLRNPPVHLGKGISMSFGR